VPRGIVPCLFLAVVVPSLSSVVSSSSSSSSLSSSPSRPRALRDVGAVWSGAIRKTAANEPAAVVLLRALAGRAIARASAR
jgi:hypothetical protein